MHLLYAVPCPWCSKTILSTRLIWLIFWIHDGWESEWEKWLTPKIFVLQEYLEILIFLMYTVLVYVSLCWAITLACLFHFFILFQYGSFDVWIVNFCLRCFWGALSSFLFISLYSSTTPFYRSEQWCSKSNTTWGTHAAISAHSTWKADRGIQTWGWWNVLVIILSVARFQPLFEVFLNTPSPDCVKM